MRNELYTLVANLSCIKSIDNLHPEKIFNIPFLPQQHKIGENPKSGFNRINSIPPVKNTEEIFEILPNDKSQPYDTYEIIERIVDEGSIEEYKAAYGKTLITTYARIDGWAVGIVANQRKVVKNKKGELEET